MLVLKTISPKKLAIYISIIVVMLGGTGFMLYQSQKLTNQQPSVVDNVMQPGNSIMAGTDIPGDQAALDQPLADALAPEAGLSRTLETVKTESNQGLDLNILANEKFKALEANVLIPRADPGLGKRDLFSPN